MKFLFDNESFSFETLRTAGFAAHGEVLATARHIGEGDEAAWHQAWKATAALVSESVLPNERPKSKSGRSRSSAAPRWAYRIWSTTCSTSPKSRPGSGQ